MAELTHETQLGILNKLLFAKGLKYKDLKYDTSIENNTFQFHLTKVIDLGYVSKKGEVYSLTKEGEKLAIHIDTDKNKLVEVRKVSVHIFCIRKGKMGKECLIYTRLKHPFYGKQGFPAGKVHYGENFIDAAKRELEEETQLTGKPILFNISHILVKDKKTKELLDDKLFLDFFVDEPKGELIGNKEGDFRWIPIKEIDRYMPNPFNGVEIYKKALEQIEKFDGVVHFEENDHLILDF